MISLRPATEDDQPFLRDLITSDIALEPWYSLLPEPMRPQIAAFQYAARRQSIAANYPDAVESIIIAEGEPAGWLVVAELAAEIRLAEILISPLHQSRGAGTYAVGEVLALGATVQKPVRLSVARDNARAIRLYEQMGFVPRGGDEIRLTMEKAA